jgi:hypothetical protein
LSQADPLERKSFAPFGNTPGIRYDSYRVRFESNDIIRDLAAVLIADHRQLGSGVHAMATTKKKKPDSKKPEMKVREGMNPIVLLAIILAGLFAYITLASVTLHILSKAGRVTDMLTYLPSNTHLVRGVNLKILSRYPGYKPEYDRYATPDVVAAIEAMTNAAQLQETYPNAFVDYMLTGEVVGGSIRVFRCRTDFDPATLGAGLQGKAVANAMAPMFELPATAPGILKGAVIYLPTYRHVVVVGGSRALVNESLKAWNDPQNHSYVAGLGDTGELVMRGHTWALVRNIGPMKGSIAAIGALVEKDKDLKAFAKVAQTANELGLWNSFGGRVRFGGAIDCGTSEKASDLAKSIREGEYGKGDEAEFSPAFKAAFPGSWNKEFRAFLAGIRFKSSGSSCYYVSSVGGQQGIQLLTIVDTTKLGARSGGADPVMAATP